MFSDRKRSTLDHGYNDRRNSIQEINLTSVWTLVSELLILFIITIFHQWPFVIGSVHVIHGTAVASRGGKRNTTKGFPNPG